MSTERRMVPVVSPRPKHTRVRKPRDEQVSVRLIRALAACWSAIRKRHKDVPGVVLLPAPARRESLGVLGYFSAMRWRMRKSGERELSEVVVVAEHLDRPAADVFETLVHESAHAMNYQRGIDDCTTSQYHNQHFKRAAEQLGLAVEQMKHYGFAKTSLLPATAERYEKEIARLDQALTVFRQKPLSVVTGGGGGTTGGAGTEDKPKEGRLRKAVCRCPFIIRLAKATIEATTIRCETCGRPFELA